MSNLRYDGKVPWFCCNPQLMLIEGAHCIKGMTWGHMFRWRRLRHMIWLWWIRLQKWRAKSEALEWQTHIAVKVEQGLGVDRPRQRWRANKITIDKTNKTMWWYEVDYIIQERSSQVLIYVYDHVAWRRMMKKLHDMGLVKNERNQ